MPHEHFEELKEWSERKHTLLIKYLVGFVRILGGATKDRVYYVDGFAGPGIYEDGAKGSPILAAEYAKATDEKHYQLYCVNVEEDEDNFRNLIQSTIPYQDKVTNYLGSFGDHISFILEQISNFPTIFFLDPFGVKGLEWQYVYPILRRTPITEILLRINPKDISRLAGFVDSNSRDSAKKCKILTDLYGFTDSSQWEQIWHTEGSEGMLRMYKDRLLKAMSVPGRGAYICTYAIRSIDGTIKYHLLFATRHPKGAILMSDVIYGREKCYERDVESYKQECLENQPFRQASLFDSADFVPSEEEILTKLVSDLKEDIWQIFAGKTATRETIHLKMLRQRWFGRIGKREMTRALKELEENDGRIVDRSGTRSDPHTKFTLITPK